MSIFYNVTCNVCGKLIKAGSISELKRVMIQNGWITERITPKPMHYCGMPCRDYADNMTLERIDEPLIEEKGVVEKINVDKFDSNKNKDL